jgi:hypothetical protein
MLMFLDANGVAVAMSPERIAASMVELHHCAAGGHDLTSAVRWLEERVGEVAWATASLWGAGGREETAEAVTLRGEPVEVRVLLLPET